MVVQELVKDFVHLLVMVNVLVTVLVIVIADVKVFLLFHVVVLEIV